MTTLKSYAKTIVQLVGAILVAIIPYLTIPQQFGYIEWINVAEVGIGAAIVWNTSNGPDWKYGKAIGSGMITVLTMITSGLGNGTITSANWVQIILSIVVTVGVHQVPNADPAPTIPQSNMNPEGNTLS